MPAHRFNAYEIPAYTRGRNDGRDGHPLVFTRSDDYRRGWYDGYREQLKSDLREYNDRHGTRWEPRGPF